MRDRLQAFDGFDVAAALGGLMLLPENAERLVRLEAAAEISATLSADPAKPSVAVDQWRALLDESPFARRYGADEDPPSGLFTKTVSHYGGSFVVFQGLDIDPANTLTTLSRSIDGGPAFPDSEFATGSRSVISAVLQLSDAIARRAQIGRGLPPIHRDTPDVFIPDDARLSELKAAVTFSRDELIALLGEHALLRLGALITAFDSPMPGRSDLLTGPLHVRPILLHEDRIVVALPGALASAAVHALLRIAQTDGFLDELARRSRAVVFDIADGALRELGATRISTEAWNVTAPVRHGTYQVDSDAILVLYVAVDDLTDYDASDARGGQWHGAQAAVTAMEKRQLEQEQQVFAGRTDLTNVTHLVVLSGLGRVSIAGMGDRLEPLRAPRLMLSPSDLQTIAVLEHGDPLCLTKYAEAQDRLRRHAQVMAFASLDEFAVYRRNSHSFYIADDALPDVFAIAPGTGSDLQLEVDRKTDVHGAVLPNGDTAEVRLLESDIRIPTYATTQRDDDTVRMLVEIDPPCWILCDVPSSEMAKVCILLAQGLAYWLWQLAPSITPLLGRAVDARGLLTIRISVQPGPGWTEVGTEAASMPIALAQADAVEVQIESSFSSALGGEDNTGERTLLGVLLRGVRERAEELGSTIPVTNAQIDSWIDRHAPLGQKKKVLFLHGQQNFGLIEDDLPESRLLQEAEEAVVLDELGPQLVARLGLEAGPIADDRRLKVLEVAVDWCFDQIDALVRTLEPKATLPWLVAHHERLLEQRARERLTIPTRMACFEAMPDVIEGIARRREQLLASTLASRALIEYVTARPPSGIRPMSVAVYDRLLALAHEAIQRAIMRDALQNRLSDEHISILGSGRLGMTRGGRFEGARTLFVEVHTRAELARAVERFGSHWRPPTGDAPAGFEAIDAAGTVEFGFALTELAGILAQLIAIGLDLEGEPKIMLRAELVTKLKSELGWSAQRVEQAIALFALEPRADFWTPPPGYANSDVYVWRFNRPLSYIRRPLLLRTTEGKDEIIWGFRHVYEAGNYLADLCRSGRLKARSATMIAAITAIREVETEAFNEAVASRYRAVPGLVVQKKVSTINGQRIERSPAEPLGDVDVLVIDQSARRIRLIEAKDVGIARTPVEMGQQLKALFVSSGGERASAEKHAERTEWVRMHLTELFAEHSIEADPATWTVEPLIVTDEELMTPFLAASPVPVVAWRDLPVP